MPERMRGNFHIAGLAGLLDYRPNTLPTKPGSTAVKKKGVIATLFSQIRPSSNQISLDGTHCKTTQRNDSLLGAFATDSNKARIIDLIKI